MTTDNASRTLLLLRHATAGRGGSDRERPLSGEGRAEAEAVGRTLAPMGVDVVLCSAARRVRETVGCLALPATVWCENDLYLAPPGALLERIQVVEDTVAVLLVVAHNPGIQGLAGTLVATDAARQRLDGRFPPATLVELAVPTTWEGLHPGSARLVDVRTPA